jgi:predicted ATPase
MQAKIVFFPLPTINHIEPLFSSNPNTKSWGLGEFNSSSDNYIEEFKSLKACIWGSDAHDFNKLFEPDCGRNLWIKGDLTFDGLFQIKFEPRDRVLIQETKPESKKSYNIIDKVKFIDSRTDAKFGSEEIVLNPNLSVIIGGKSTGKSLLLYHIAKSINHNLLEDVNKQSERDDIGYDFENDSDFDFKVIWKDEGENSLKTSINDSDTRQITYIPQHYLSTISKSKNLGNKDALNKFIKDTLIVDDDSKQKEEDVKQIVQITEKSIGGLVNDLYNYREDTISKLQSKKEKGDKVGIKKYIKELNQEVALLKKNSTLSEEELNLLEVKTNREQQLQKSYSNYNNDIKNIKTFSNVLITKINEIRKLKDEFQGYLLEDDNKEIFVNKYEFIENANKIINDDTYSLVNEITGSIVIKQHEILKEIEVISSETKPLLRNLKHKEIIQVKTEQIKEEEKKIHSIEILEKEIEEKRIAIRKTITSIIEEYTSIYTAFNMHKEFLLKAKEDIKDVQINVKFAFNSTEFSNVFKNSIYKSEVKLYFSEYANDNGDFDFTFTDIDKLKVFLKEIIELLINNKLKLFKNVSEKELLISFFKNFFVLDFYVTYKNDSLDKMSPGKRNLVLLKLIIEKSNQEWPVLIDQPEDDLDNRSVYKDLVSFLREKKKDRQIIIVTHNPNAVVGADAEQVIVANQSGQEIDRDNTRYLFEYVSGSLEHSKKQNQEQSSILESMGIKEHVCDILEGGEKAFKKRENKYRL